MATQQTDFQEVQERDSKRLKSSGESDQNKLKLSMPSHRKCLPLSKPFVVETEENQNSFLDEEDLAHEDNVLVTTDFFGLNEVIGSAETKEFNREPPGNASYKYDFPNETDNTESHVKTKQVKEENDKDFRNLSLYDRLHQIENIRKTNNPKPYSTEMPFSNIPRNSFGESTTTTCRKEEFQSSLVLNLPEMDADEWHYDNARFKKRLSSLSTWKCWKCRHPGHLPEDCTASIGIASAASLSNPFQYVVESGENHHSQSSTGCIYSRLLRKTYKKCKKIEKTLASAKCHVCSSRANLCSCLDCEVVVCDSEGHLTGHLRDNPTHNKLYSFKLKRQLKCYKSTCEEMNAYKLIICPSCLGNYFNRYYSMINASWSRKGLQCIPNALACEEHFQWHLLNCENASSASLDTLVDKKKLESVELSEFFF